eukprot:1384601-Amorphochlora_amoeboformis.AAC.2
MDDSGQLLSTSVFRGSWQGLSGSRIALSDDGSVFMISLSDVRVIRDCQTGETLCKLRWPTHTVCTLSGDRSVGVCVHVSSGPIATN